MENLNNGNTDLKYLDNSHCVQVPVAGNSCSSARNWNWLHIIFPRNYDYFSEQTGLFSFLIKETCFLIWRYSSTILIPSTFNCFTAVWNRAEEFYNSVNVSIPLDTSVYMEIILSHHLKHKLHQPNFFSYLDNRIL